MSKYYTPEIEEFFVGFEYEWLNEENKWIKESSPTEISQEGFDEQTYGLRVKYLDKEDIESLGFKEGSKDFYIVKLRDYYISVEYFLKDKGFYINIGQEENQFSFGGYIKNKSELKKLLKQLNINE